jgi:transposase InsO family protein
MTWIKVTAAMQRLRFVKLAVKAQKSMAVLCREFGLSRRIGYKWKKRFERDGLRGLREGSRRPKHCPRQISGQWLQRIRRLRRRHRSWGSRKLAARLRREHPGQKCPSARTIGKWLKRLGLNRCARRRRIRRGPPLKRPALTIPRRSNHVWTADFKGWFRTQDGRRVDPLTVRDLFSRKVLTIRLLKDQSWEPVQREFRRLFRMNGCPKIIRVDNGHPFGSTGPMGLSRLSAWWTALGICVEFIAPGHPEQNGAHEQMHRVFKAETTRPPSRHRRAQQRRTDRWIKTYNQIRPHQALAQRTPAEFYRRGPGRDRQPKVFYPRRWAVRGVRSNGQIKWRGRKRFVGEAFVGYPVGLKPGIGGKTPVYFAELLIGELRLSDLGGMRPITYVRGGSRSGRPKPRVKC